MRQLAVAGFLAFTLVACSPSGPPQTSRAPVTDTYHEVSVTEDYRWLEDWDDPEVRSWSDEQNRYTRTILDGLPHVSEIRSRIAEILESESAVYFGLSWHEGTLFAIKRQPPKQQPFLVALASPDDTSGERVILDPNALDPTGGTTIDWYVPSPDGALVAVSLSKGGSESGDLHVVDAGTGESVEEVIPRVNGGTAGGDLAWTTDGSGFFYTRYPRSGERADEDLSFYQQAWFHRLGSASDEDRYELGDDFPRIAETRLQVDSSSGRLLATVQYGDSGRFEHYLREPDGNWNRLTRYEDRIVQARFAPDGSLFLISRFDAPKGKLLKLNRDRRAISQAETIVDESSDTIVHDFYGSSPMVVTSSRVYLTYQLGGPSTIRSFDHRGAPQAGPDVLAVSSVGQIVPLPGDVILYSNRSYLQPSAWYRFDPGKGSTETTALVVESPVDFSDTEAVRETATSKDGTEVPLTVLRLKGTELDGSNPTLLTGYGGFGISLRPRFEPLARTWIEQGGVVTIANLRGGGEFGEAWHQAGMLTNKQNVFDDFAAAMQHLIATGYTSEELLAIRGASNGGLLMGAMITQHPARCRAVMSAVGIYDMLRVELSANGAFNIPEYGSVTEPDQFRALHAYSPYHNVVDGTSYPAVLFVTGANDPRVDPMQSRKMTARLQAATASDRPILLRTSDDTGHGGGTPLNTRIDEQTDMYAFLFNELGVEYGD
jgi:prolyl oligopeptidase